MTSIASLFASPAADVTVNAVRQLVADASPESLTLEYKERYTRRIAESVAAMANSYGGVILVGVTDAGEDRLVGVPHDTVAQVVDLCHQKLEPPWQPEILTLPLNDDNCLIVLRVHHDRAPRPVLVDGAGWIR